MKILCIIGLMVILAFFFLAALPLMFGAIANRDDFETGYTLGLISTMVMIIAIISAVMVNFYFTPEIYGYQKIVSENCVESED